MKTTTEPPSMTKEQRAELRELRQRESTFTRALETGVRQASKQLASLDTRLVRECAKIDRAAVKAKRMLEQTIRAEQRELRTYLNRVEKGNCGQSRELAAINRRISILEGRLNS